MRKMNGLELFVRQDESVPRWLNRKERLEIIEACDKAFRRRGLKVTNAWEGDVMFGQHLAMKQHNGEGCYDL